MAPRLDLEEDKAIVCDILHGKDVEEGEQKPLLQSNRSKLSSEKNYLLLMSHQHDIDGLLLILRKQCKLGNSIDI